MNLSRYLAEERVDLLLDGCFDSDHPASTEAVAEHMASLLQSSPDIINPSKLRIDLVNVERRKPSLVGSGVYMPHVRTMQARKLVMGVALSRDGLDLDASDGEPVHLVIASVSPPYDDRTYLLAQRRLGERLLEGGWIDRLRACEVPGEVLRALDT